MLEYTNGVVSFPRLAYSCKFRRDQLYIQPVERTQQRVNKVTDRIIFPVYRLININDLVWFGMLDDFQEKFLIEAHRLGRISKIFHKHAQQVIEYTYKNGIPMVSYDPVQLQWETTIEIESVNPNEALVEIGSFGRREGRDRI